MTKVATLSADLDVKTSRFEAGLARARARTKETQSTIEKFATASQKSFKLAGAGVNGIVGQYAALKAGIATVIGAAGLTMLIKKQIESNSAIKDGADRLQLSTDALQKYQYMAKLVGISNEQLETIITKLNAKIADGSYKYKNAEEGLNSIADAVKNAKTQAQVGTVVNDAFGAKLGSKVIPLLKEGSAGLKAMGDEAQRTGNVISANTIEATDKLGDTLDTLVSTIQKSFSQGFLDEIVGASGDLRDVYADPEFAKNIQNIGSLFGDLAENALWLVSVIGELIGKYKELSALSKGSYGMDEKFFDWASKNFDSPKHQRQRALKKLGLEGQALGPGGDTGRMMRMGAGLMGQPMPSLAAPAKTPPWKPGGNTTEQDAKSIKAIFDALQKESDELTVQIDLYGQKTSVIERARKLMEIQNKLAADGIVLSKDEQAALIKKLDLMAQQKDLLEQQEEYQKTQEEFVGIIRNSFEEAITSGESLSDVLKNLVKDLAKMALQKSLLDPLFGNGQPGNNGILGGILGQIGGAIFGSMPSHATGQKRVPFDMVARVHKDEEIVPARQTRNRGGRGELNINIVDKNNTKVTEQKSADPGIDLELVLDRANARNINRPGTDTSKALSAMQSKSLVRR